MQLIIKAFQVIRSTSKGCSFLGLLSNKSRSHSLLWKPNTMRCPMLLKKLFGFGCSLVFWSFLVLVLFLFLVTIRLLVHCRTHPQSPHAPNILTFNIILFTYMLPPALFPQHGFLLEICQQTFLLKLYISLFFLAIAMFWVSLFLLSLLNYSSFPFNFSFLSFPFWWGCVDIVRMYIRGHVTSRVLYSSCCSSVVISFLTLRTYVYSSICLLSLAHSFPSTLYATRYVLWLQSTKQVDDSQ